MLLHIDRQLFTAWSKPIMLFIQAASAMKWHGDSAVIVGEEQLKNRK